MAKQPYIPTVMSSEPAEADVDAHTQVIAAAAGGLLA
jgi:hypothetical protein